MISSSRSSDNGWKLYDGVTIPPDGKFPSMTGVVVYIEKGGGGDDGDTIGIRLTGDSEGMGDHSGSVDGIDYFECPVNSGVLTTTSKVTKRRLTINEEAMIRAMLQPKPISIPVPTSISMAGLSPSAVARMAQLNQRMQANNTMLPPKKKNHLPPTAPPSAPPFQTTSTKEPLLQEEEEEPPKEEKRLSRLDILRQKKEAIRQKKLALQEKVQDKKQEKQHEDEEAKANMQAPTEDSAAVAHPPPMEAVAQKAERRGSKDSLEKLWISELRQESPPAAARYGSMQDDDDYEDDDNDINRTSKKAKKSIPKELEQPSLLASKSSTDDDQDMEEVEETKASTTSGYKKMSRLQQLRQKKRLLEALPASINAPAPGPEATEVSTSAAPLPTLLRPNHAAAVAAARNNNDDDDDDDDDDQSSRASTLSTQMSDMELEVEDGANDAAALSASAFQESLTITAAEAAAAQTENTNTELQEPSHKRRRMLGLGFLPGNRRLQKRQKGGYQ